MKRKLIRISLVLLVLLGLPLIGWRALLAIVINKKLTDIRAAGLPTNGEELNRWYAAVPDTENVALVMTQAFALRRLYSDSRTNLIFNFKLPRRGERLSPDQSELLQGYVAMNEARMRKADEALKLTNSRYPINWSQLMHTPLPHLTWLKEIAELHQFAAVLALQSGNISAASSNVVTILALARTLDNEPCLISQLVRFKLIGIAFSTLERRANAGAFSPAEIAKLSDAFTRTTCSNVCAHALIGERAITIPYFRITKDELARIRPPTDGSDPAKTSPVPCYGPAILRWIGYYELDYGSYLIGMNKGIALLSNAPPDNLMASGYFARAGEGSWQRKRTTSAQTLSAYSGAAWRENEGVAHQRLAFTAIAVESFRNAIGRLSKELEELVPKYFEEVPEDPFTGLELEYLPKTSGYVLYSVGPDRQDDGGLEKVDKKESDDKQSYDITFTVER